MLRCTTIAAVLMGFHLWGQPVLLLGGGAQYDIAHSKVNQRGLSSGRAWIPPDLTGWGGHFGISLWTGQSEFALRLGAELQWQHVSADYSVLVEMTNTNPLAGQYTGRYEERLTLWKFPVMASVRLSDKARFDGGLEPYLVNRGQWRDAGEFDPSDNQPTSTTIPYDHEGRDDGVFKKGGLAMGANFICELDEHVAYSISYWRDLNGYQDASSRVVAHHNMFGLTLWLLVGAEKEMPREAEPGNW